MTHFFKKLFKVTYDYLGVTEYQFTSIVLNSFYGKPLRERLKHLRKRLKAQ